MNTYRWRILVVGTIALTLVLAASSVRAADPPTLFQRSYQLEAQKKHRSALQALMGLSNSHKRTYFYWLRRAWLTYRVADYNDAIASYRRAIALERNAVEPWIGITLPQMASRRFVDAAASARRVLSIEPKSYVAQSRLAYCLYSLGQHKKAERLYAQLLARYPADLTMRTGLGWAQLKQGKRSAARAAFSAVLRVSPKNVSAKAGARALGIAP